MKHLLLFSFCFAMGCDPAPSPQERCPRLKSQAQLLLFELLHKERVYHLDKGTFTSNFALLNWTPRVETSLSFRIPVADKNHLELSASEKLSPDGWAADTWSLDDQGGFLHITHGCRIGEQRERQQEAARRFLKKERVAFRFLSDDFGKKPTGAWRIEIPPEDLSSSSKCAHDEKPLQAGQIDTSKLLRSLNDVGAGHLLTTLQENLVLSGKPQKKPREIAAICRGQREGSTYFRQVNAVEKTETWLVFPAS